MTDLNTLAIDIGGSGIKLTVLDSGGEMIVERVRAVTPTPCPPDVLVHLIKRLVRNLPAFDRISVGFPGVVRKGVVLTAPNLGTDLWRGFAFAKIMSDHYGKPVRILNDAEVHGFGVVLGSGLEAVLTLGTGAGTALFLDGMLVPHLELGQHPIHDNLSYDQYVGNKALMTIGTREWNKRVIRTIEVLFSLLHYDVLYLGGGNATLVSHPPDGAIIVSNDAGLTGGIRLWEPIFERAFGP